MQEASPRRQGTKHFSYNFYTYTDPFHSELMEEHNRNRVARLVLGSYATWSTGTRLSVPVLNFQYWYSTSSGQKIALSTDTRLSVPVLNILRSKNYFEYRYLTFSIGTHLQFLQKWPIMAIFTGNLPTKTKPTTKLT